MSERMAWLVPACIVLALAAAPTWAQTSSNTSLPPLAPPVDVPMHVPQPPRDSDVAQSPSNVPTSNAPASAQTGPVPTVPARHPKKSVELAQRGTITPIRRPCRNATYRVLIDGRQETAIAHLCRTADGRWRLTP